MTSCHILVASLFMMALFETEPSELDWLQVYDMTFKTEPSEFDWLQVYDMTH